MKFLGKRTTPRNGLAPAVSAGQRKADLPAERQTRQDERRRHLRANLYTARIWL